MVKILSALFGKKKKETPIYLKPEKDWEKIRRQVEKGLMERNAYLESELMKAKRQLDKFDKKEEKKAEKEKKIIQSEMVKVFDESQKKQEEKKVRFRLDSKQISSLPAFVSAGRKPFGKFKKFYGIELFELDSGHYIIYPIVTDKKGKEKKTVQEGVFSFDEMFYNSSNIVSQLKGGLVHSSIQMLEGGKLALIPKIMKERKAKIAGLSDKERYQFENQIARLIKKLDDMSSELNMAQKRESQYIEEINDLKIGLATADAQTENSHSYAAAIMDRYISGMNMTSKLYLANQDAESNRVLTERLNARLIDTIDDLQERVAIKLSQTDREATIEEIKTDIIDIVKGAKEVLKQDPILISQPMPQIGAPKKKPSPKAKEVDEK